MISLASYREFWESVKAQVPAITDVMPVTMDDGMSKRILSLKGGSVTLFFLPPHSEGRGGDADSFTEQNICVIFVMERYDPQRRSPYEVLESVQPVIESVKALLVERSGGCGSFSVDVSTINTLPETSFYSGFAGWSIGFSLK